MASPPLYVIDASVLIDCHAGGVLPELPRLPGRWVVPDVILAEMQEPSGALLAAYGIQGEPQSGDEVREALALAGRNRHVSTNDCFALVLAQVRQATLLTGDSHLRAIAEQRGLAVRGTLWILDRLVLRGTIIPSQAVQALEQMLAHGSRLPANECRPRLARWGRSSSHGGRGRG